MVFATQIVLLLALSFWGHSSTTRPSAKLAQEMLAAHNVARAGVHAPPLVWSEKLASVAQKWAEQLASRHEFKHRPKLEYGENLYEITNATATPAQVVGAWTSESRNYDYKTNSCRGVCGHFTQVVWRAAREVGCGVARSGDREIWVCEYNPPGNWAGERPW